MVHASRTRGPSTPPRVVPVDDGRCPERVNRVFSFALQREIVHRNPITSVEKPQAKNKTKARILEADEVRTLIDSAPEKYRLLLMVTAYAGLETVGGLGLR